MVNLGYNIVRIPLHDVQRNTVPVTHPAGASDRFRLTPETTETYCKRFCRLHNADAWLVRKADND